MKGNKENGLYFMEGATIIGSAAQITASKICDCHLWHQILAHISEGGIQALYKQNLLGEGQLNDLNFCEVCVLGKATRLKFKRSENKTKENLSYIHSDLWGPAKVESKGGEKYFITFIDDHSRKVWVYTLKSKDQAF